METESSLEVIMFLGMWSYCLVDTVSVRSDGRSLGDDDGGCITVLMSLIQLN